MSSAQAFTSGALAVKHTGQLLAPTLAGLLLVLSVGACSAKSPAQAQDEVAKAETTGEQGISDAKEAAATSMANARKDLTNTQLDVAQDGAEAARTIEVAKAEAAYKVALARCDGDTGDARTACRNLADKELATAKANAVSTKVANVPKP
jgi:hypothetical protein